LFGLGKAAGQHLDEEEQEQEAVMEQAVQPAPATAADVTPEEPAPDPTQEELEQAEIAAACEALVRNNRPAEQFVFTVPEPATDVSAPGAEADAGAVEELDRARREAAEYQAALAQSEQQMAALRAELDAARSGLTAVADVAADEVVLKQLDDARREAAEYRAALDRSEQQIAELRADLDAARTESQSPSAFAGIAAEAGLHQLAREDAESQVAALSAELDKVQADVSDSAAEFEVVVSELREARARLDELAADRYRLSGELAEAVQARADSAAEVDTLRRTVEQQRGLDEELARVREREARQAFAAEEARATLLLRQAEIDDLQQRLLESEQQRADEAASLLSVLATQERGAPGTGGWLD
jgi:chromosome segregation ATPase